MKRFDKFSVSQILAAVAVVIICGSAIVAQSTNQEFPTAVTTSEISGLINARDVGDARLTSYFYAFEGGQGDLFVNIATKNFTGDIDIWTVAGLRPLTKVVVYADLAESETGRVIYLRKPEKIILRVQGRSPGDEAASFRIKFAGSFVASAPVETPQEPELPKVTAGVESGIRVNSVGTIVEIIPKATPKPAETAAKIEERENEVAEKTDAVAGVDEPAKAADSEIPVAERKVEVVITDNIPTFEKNVPAAVPPKALARTRTRRARRAAALAKARKAATVDPPKETAVSPLASINLVIDFKDGTKISRPMSEVFRFTVNKGILTVISKDGSTGRYSILDVAKVTIQ